MTTAPRWPIRPLCALVLFALSASRLAHADYYIRSPDEIDEGAFEFEHNGATTIDPDPARRGAVSETLELGYGVTSWWHPSLELDAARDPGPGQHAKFDGLTWQNVFRFTEPGENWADFGFYAEYGHATLAGTPDDVLFGPLVQKDIGRTTHTLNLFFERQFGPNQDIRGFDISYAWQSRWNVFRLASPAIEIYGDAGRIDHPLGYRNQQMLAGPVVVGTLLVGPLGNVHYELGYLFGATRASADGTIRWQLEWETRF